MLWTIREDDGSLTTINTDMQEGDGFIQHLFNFIIDMRMMFHDNGTPFHIAKIDKNGDVTEEEDFRVYGITHGDEEWGCVWEAINAEDQLYGTML